MPKNRLPAIEITDMAGGLDKFNSETLVAANNLTDSDNMRHDGPGRMRRRNGMKRFGIDETTVTQLEPLTPDKTTRFSRLVIPFIQRVTQSIPQFNAILNLRHQLSSAFDSGPRLLIKLRDDGSKYTSPEAVISYNTNPDAPFFSDPREQVGRAFFDNRIYVGSDFGNKSGTSIANITLTGDQYEFGYLVKSSNPISPTPSVNDKISGPVSGAVGFVGRVISDELYLYNWNGTDFDSDETIDVNEADSLETVTGFHEHQLPGVILEYDVDVSGLWFARRWGIRKITDADAILIGVAANAVGTVGAGTYRVRFTLIRAVGGALSSGDNPKLSGHTLVSESAPSKFVQVEVAANEKIEYDLFAFIPSPSADDPQITHVRFYRNDSSGTDITDFKHVVDIAIGDSSTIVDNLTIIQIQTQTVLIDTFGLQVFGEQGENCGHAIEVVNRRIFVGGNKNNPQRLYASSSRSEHKFSEYFFTSLDIADTSGQSIVALKWWARRLYVFMERSIYEVREASTSDIGLDSYRQVTRELGCITRNGVIDMGNFMFVMTEKGLLAFNGTNFNAKAVTLGVETILGIDLLGADIIKTDTHIFIISTNSRVLGVMITIKHSDASFALGLDRLNKTITLPDSIGFAPSLANFGNTTNDSNFVMAAFPRVVAGSPADKLNYNIVKYDLAGEDFDHLDFSGSAADDLKIVPVFSPKVLDFGAFNEARLESLIAFIIQSGIDDTDQKAPTGRWLVEFFLNRGPDGTAEAFHSVVLRPTIDRTVDPALGTDSPKEPLQHKYTRPFAGSPLVSKQTGGVFSGSGSAAASGFSSIQEILFSADLNQDTIGRLWKIIFKYEGTKQFEFTSFAMRFIAESET